VSLSRKRLKFNRAFSTLYASRRANASHVVENDNGTSGYARPTWFTAGGAIRIAIG